LSQHSQVIGAAGEFMLIAVYAPNVTLLRYPRQPILSTARWDELRFRHPALTLRSRFGNRFRKCVDGFRNSPERGANWMREA